MKYLVSLFVFLTASVASACSFTPDADIFKTPNENYPNYQFVISGSFTERAEKEISHEGATYTFKVAHVHKGELADEVITMESPGHSCGYFGEPGRDMILFSNDLSVIDESNPKYYFNSEVEAVEAGRALEGGEKQEDSKEDEMTCTEQYEPVCGLKEGGLVEETFSNPCYAEREGAEVLYEGECQTVQAPAPDPSSSLPSSDPTDGFEGPKEDPPYDNGFDANDDVSPELSVWDRILAWISRLFSF